MEYSLDLPYVLSIVIVAYFLGFKSGALLSKLLFLRILEDLGVTPEQLQDLNGRVTKVLAKELNHTNANNEPETIELVIEQHKDQLFAYNMLNNQFLAQGSSAEDLVNKLSEMLSDYNVIVSEENGGNFIKDACS